MKDAEVETLVKIDKADKLLGNAFNKKLGWTYSQHCRLRAADREVMTRIMTSAMFQKHDTDKNGTVNFDEYFAYRAKGGQIPAELKA